MIYLCQMSLFHFRLKMSAIFILKKELRKNQTLPFLKCRYFIVGSPVDINVSVF